MVDTIKAYLKQRDIDEYHSARRAKNQSLESTNVKRSLSDYAPRLDGIEKIEIQLKEKRFVTRHTDNFTFTYYYQNSKLGLISIEGSLPKLLESTNHHRTDLLVLKRAIMKLGRENNLPLALFRVTRVDIAVNMIMNKAPEAYIGAIDGLPNYPRFSKSTKHYLLFKNGSKTFVFYNKANAIKNEIKELQKKIESHNDPHITKKLQTLEKAHAEAKNKKILRIELRIFKDTRGEFNKKLTLYDIMDKSIYKYYPKVFDKMFKKIRYKRTILFENVATPKDLKDCLMMEGIKSMGGYAVLEERLNISQLSENITSKLKAEVKRSINAANENKVVIKTDSLEIELKKKTKKALLKAGVTFRTEFDEV
jgi:hypothetical protein